MKNYAPILMLFIVMQCSFLQAKTKDEEENLPMITNTPSSPEVFSTYFKAMYETASGKTGEAIKKFTSLRASKAPVVTDRGYIRALKDTKQYNKILAEKEILDKNFSNDPNIQIAIVESLAQSNQKQEASARLLKLADKFKGNQAVTSLAIEDSLRTGNLPTAERIIDSAVANEPSKPNNYMLHFIKAQILYNQNKKEKALEALKLCLASYRNFEKGWLLYALLEEQLGNLQEAIKGYAAFLDIVGREPSVQNHLLELLFKQKMIKENKSNIAVPASCLQKAILLFEHSQPLEALKHLEECLKIEPNNNEARLLKIEILESIGQIHQAFNLLSEWMNLHPENEIWFKTASLLHKKGLKRHDLAGVFQQIEKKNPNAILPVKYLADLYLRANNQQQALLYLQKVITMAPDPLLKAKAHYQRARIYQQRHHSEAMAQELETGYAIYKNFAPLNNMLAYHYAGKAHNRVKALELAKQALKAEPDNPHYLDTRGYISYKQGDLNEALKIIEPLASRVPDDKVIENHLRKIQQALSRQALNQGHQNK